MIDVCNLDEAVFPLFIFPFLFSDGETKFKASLATLGTTFRYCLPVEC